MAACQHRALGAQANSPGLGHDLYSEVAKSVSVSVLKLVPTTVVAVKWNSTVTNFSFSNQTFSLKLTKALM